MSTEINGIDRVLEIGRGNKYAGLVLFFSLLVALVYSPFSLAQHEMHNMPGEGAVHVTTMPANDEVLATSPKSIMLRFGSEVQLVTLALREPSQGKEIIDIGFRYSGETGAQFVQPLPVLAAANYYVAEWAILDGDRLLKGVFYFSFGDDARPPSFYRNEMDHQMQMMSPDYRLQ